MGNMWSEGRREYVGKGYWEPEETTRGKGLNLRGRSEPLVMWKGWKLERSFVLVMKKRFCSLNTDIHD